MIKELEEVREALETAYFKGRSYQNSLKQDQVTSDMYVIMTEAKQALTKLDAAIGRVSQLEKQNAKLLKFIKQDIWDETTRMCKQLELGADISTIAGSLQFIRLEVCNLSIENNTMKGNNND